MNTLLPFDREFIDHNLAAALDSIRDEIKTIPLSKWAQWMHQQKMLDIQAQKVGDIGLIQVKAIMARFTLYMDNVVDVFLNFRSTSSQSFIRGKKATSTNRFRDLGIHNADVSELYAELENMLKRFYTETDNAEMAAKTSSTGGIDLNSDKLALEVRNNGQEMAFKADPAMLEEWRNAPGFTPVIISITPAGNIPAFLGITAP